jgi:Tol biopolymer transport system component
MDARAAVAALLLWPLVFSHTANVRSLHRRAPARLLFAASVVAPDQAPRGFTPSPDIYSLASTGHLAQLTFAGGDSPVPSPDGRLVAFARGGDLWLMSADGRHQRLLARRGLEPAWSPDSRRIAYASGTPSDIAGIRVIDANGTADRMLVRGNVASPVWSPDGRSLAFVRTTAVQTYQVVIVRKGRQRMIATASGNGAPSWSADGRWIAYAGCAHRCGVVIVHPSVVIVHPNGSGRRVVTSGTNPIWSPHGRQLAYIQNGAIAVYDEKLLTGGVLVAPPPVLTGPLSWSPDGSKIAYEVFNGELERGQLETVSLAGRVRSLGTYPDAGAPVWTAPPAGVRYRPPQPVGPVAVGDELRFRLPVEEIAADGNSVAYRTCGAIGVWAKESETVTAVSSELPLCNFQDDYLQFYSLALAADRVAWGQVDGGNVQGSALVARSTADPATQIALAAGPGITNGDPRGTARVGDLIGAGSLLVLSTWAYCDEFANNTCWQLPPQQRPLVSQTLWRVREPSWPGVCPGLGYSSPPSARCELLRTEPGPLRPLDVDAGRVVASGDNATLVLDADGRELLSVPISTTAAQLAGSDLILLVPGELRDYDARTGALLHSWPLPDVSLGGLCGLPSWECGSPRLRLEGAARGVVAYILDGKLHLLRLRDGADVLVADASAAALDDSGLFYTYRATGIWPGRLRFVPFDQLPLR